MNFIDEVRADRQLLAQTLKKHPGFRQRIVEDIYPDRAHFIFELLQNAEDVNASEVTFTLMQDSLIFGHNGRPFTEKDIWKITNIGEETKAEDDDKIGRFGIGFKAVFAFSETPHIWSPSYSFAISDFVLPAAIQSKPELDKKTQFEFPFNNPQKPAECAYKEIKAGLEGISEMTLPFLSNLQILRWKVGELSGEVSRTKHSDTHIEVRRKTNGNKLASSHFLLFSKPVIGKEKQRISIAYVLDFLPKITTFDPNKILAEQFKIVPAKPGRVAVFFPAEKETSGLYFHLNAPFIPEVSRASIKDTPANEPLFNQLATLAALSLHQIRNLKLLTTEFLGVLPNPQDVIPECYKPIREAIVVEMNEKELTPTHAKSHAPAKYLVQGSSMLKELLSNDDLELLIDYDDTPPQWAASASQKSSRADHFLLSLSISEWDISKFVEKVIEKTSIEYPARPTDDVFAKWLASKSIKWHQEFYAFLYSYLQKNPSEKAEFRFLKIVRLNTENYCVATECYFPPDDVSKDDSLPQVESGVYSCGKNKTQQEESRKFLEEIGVREIGEREQVQLILKRRYAPEANIPSDKTHFRDLKRFIALIQRDGGSATLFPHYDIFKIDSDNWGKPNEIYLDAPYFNTNLSIYYKLLGTDANKYSLSPDYLHSKIPPEEIGAFAQAVGAQTCLEIKNTSCVENPQWEYLRNVPGDKLTSPKNDDWIIPNLDNLLQKPSEKLSRLVWKTMRLIDNKYLHAVYQKNERNGKREASSQLVHVLRNRAWIPQKKGRFVIPAEADQALLPEGFPFDSGDEWLKKIQFGERTLQRTEEARKLETFAKEQGLSDRQALDDGLEFGTYPENQRRSILEHLKQARAAEQHEKLTKNILRRKEKEELSITSQDLKKACHVDGKTELDEEFRSNPEPQPIGNLEKRSSRVEQELDEKIKNARKRSERFKDVIVSKMECKNPQTKEFLLQEYNGKCQITWDQQFPKRDGKPYFEACYLIPREKAEWVDNPGNVFCLSAEYSARWQFGTKHINPEKLLELDLTKQGENNLFIIEIELCGEKKELRITPKHLVAIQTFLKKCKNL